MIRMQACAHMRVVTHMLANLLHFRKNKCYKYMYRQFLIHIIIHVHTAQT